MVNPDIFIDELKGCLVSPQRVAESLNQASDAVDEKQRLLESMRKQVQRVRQEADQVYRLYLDGGLTGQQFKERYQPLDDRKNQRPSGTPDLRTSSSTVRVMLTF